MTVSILHNPRCSKSRQTLDLIKQKGIEPQIVEYLKNPPTVAELQEIIGKLGLSAKDIIRTKESEYKELNISADDVSESELLAILHKTPKLIERPIVINGNKATIGRPPENVLDII